MPPRMSFQTCRVPLRARALCRHSQTIVPVTRAQDAIRLPMVRRFTIQRHSGQQKKHHRSQAVTWLASAGLFTFLTLLVSQKHPALLEASAVLEDASQVDDNVPRYRLSEIRKHDSTSPRPWIVHGNKVYDITDWVPAHPGGDVILRAAGGSIDRYWDIFSIHKSQYVYDILSQYLIGYVDAADLTPDGSRPAQSDDVEDPFSGDPARHPDLITRTEKPRNAECPPDALADHFLTPNELFYVRNHMWVPTITNADEHTLTIELPDGSVKKYTLKDLKTRFRQHTVTSVLQCSGNRRSNMSRESGRKANGLPWDVGAISNAQWHGVLLADVLADAGFHLGSGDGSNIQGQGQGQRQDEDAVKHVHFSAMEAYSASIPVRKATDPRGDVLLAWGMNGEPLPRDHGYPLRSIVPGHVAARSVKWLDRITLSDEESPSQWQRRDYKCFGPNQTDVDWDAAPAIQEMPVQSAITSVKLQKPNLSSEQGGGSPYRLSVGGYAYSGGGREIVRVDVSVDGGRTWSQARLLPDCVSKGASSPCSGNAFWAWKRWRFEGEVPAGALRAADEARAGDQAACTTVVVKATDETYNTQPESHAATWNLRGNLASAWHRMRVCTDDCQASKSQASPVDPDLA